MQGGIVYECGSQKIQCGSFAFEQAEHFIAVRRAKGRACARAEKRQAFAGFNRGEDEFKILLLQRCRSPWFGNRLKLVDYKRRNLYSDLRCRETSIAWYNTRTTSMIFSLLR